MPNCCAYTPCCLSPNFWIEVLCRCCWAYWHKHACQCPHFGTLQARKHVPSSVTFKGTELVIVSFHSIGCVACSSLPVYGMPAVVSAGAKSIVHVRAWLLAGHIFTSACMSTFLPSWCKRLKVGGLKVAACNWAFKHLSGGASAHMAEVPRGFRKWSRDVEHPRNMPDVLYVNTDTVQSAWWQGSSRNHPTNWLAQDHSHGLLI